MNPNMKKRIIQKWIIRFFIDSNSIYYLCTQIRLRDGDNNKWMQNLIKIPVHGDFKK